MHRVQSLAHRGFSSAAPENTLVAYRKAIELKPDMMECDIRQSSDGRLIVIHDAKVDRTTNGTGPVAEKTLDELRKLDAGYWFSPEFAGERLPTLDEVLDISKGRAKLVIEIKEDDLEEQVLQAVQDRGMSDEVYLLKDELMRPIASFYHDTEGHMKVSAMQIPVIPLIWRREELGDADESAEVNGAVLGIYYQLITRDLVEATHAANMSLMAWTVDKENDIRAVVEMGVDIVASNDLALLHRVLEEMGVRPGASAALLKAPSNLDNCRP